MGPKVEPWWKVPLIVLILISLMALSVVGLSIAMDDGSSPIVHPIDDCPEAPEPYNLSDGQGKALLITMHINGGIATAMVADSAALSYSVNLTMEQYNTIYNMLGKYTIVIVIINDYQIIGIDMEECS